MENLDIVMLEWVTVIQALKRISCLIDPIVTKLKSFLCFVTSGPAFKARRSMGSNKSKTSFLL